MARRPPARLSLAQALETLLERILGFEHPADAQLSRFFREHPGIGRRDRGLLADTCFDVLRNRRLYAHLAQGGSGSLARRLALLSPAAAPLARNADEAAWLARSAHVDRDSLPGPIRLSLPDWLAGRIERDAPAGEFEALAASLLEPAPLDLRVNSLKSDVPAVLAALAAAGIEAHALAGEPTAVRVAGKPALEKLAAFADGWFEVQDVGSQRLCRFAAPRRGQIVVDFCAGAGGKTLALAAAMRSTGQIYACDVAPRRLARMRPRLARSGASNVQPLGIDTENDRRLDRLASRADLVLVDAPCSGTGTLRRNPDLKWRIGPDDIARLAGQQFDILAAAARLVKPGGALVYATCSLLDEENAAVAARFDATVGAGWSRDDAAGEAGVMRLWPHRDDSDGFFAVRWRRAT